MSSSRRISGRSQGQPRILQRDRSSRAKLVVESRFRPTQFQKHGLHGHDEQSYRADRNGMVLLLVLVVVVALAFSAYTFTVIMRTEQEAAIMAGRRIQSRYLVDSGADSIRLFLSQKNSLIEEAGGTYDNPVQFQALTVYVSPDQTASGQVTCIAPNLDDSGMLTGFRFGLMDESSKLNVNVLPQVDNLLADGGRTLLMALPAMTEETADAIMDWIDTNDEPRDYGVEASYYTSQSPPYTCKNGPLESIEELLMVRGVTPELLFGLDDNHNGILDDTEAGNAGERGLAPEMALGWANYLTLWSAERNFNDEGLPRIDLNQADLEVLFEELSAVFSAEWANFIVAMRLNGPYEGDGESTGGLLGGELDLTLAPSYDFNQVLDLVDARVEVLYLDAEEPVILDSPFQSVNLPFVLPILLPNVTTVASDTIPGRININQCTRAVMLGIPGMDEATVDQIISRRDIVDDGSDANRQFETWILVEGIVDLATMRQLLPFVCVGGDVFRAELVGYFDDGMASSRAEVVIDRTEVFPRIIFWRDKSHLPLGYQLNTLGLNYQATQ